ncbi:MAG: DUF4364 family protein [Clostridiaceae bacterium]|nr:DUF4364 family protein [Clostridiaceae bacterium]
MNRPDSNNELAINKLILLYLIDKININLSNLQITKLILENNLINYFFLQQYLNELHDDNLLSSEIINKKTFYKITDKGKTTLKHLDHLIPSNIKNKIDDTIKTARKKIRNETFITADFIPESESKYTVSCSVREDDFSLIELKIAVGTKDDARCICDNWKNYSQYIYSEIIESLTRKRN